jgi:hypothetical protein
MPMANISDRKSIEAIYPRDVFEAERGMNAAGDATIFHGLRIESNVDEHGDFHLSRASRHSAEATAGRNTIFVVPQLGKGYRGFSEQPGRHGAVTENFDILPSRPAEEYDAFIDEVIERARNANLPEPPDENTDILSVHG